jgi:heme/copper-type cytochrome/quinol oxidase subunit 2
MEKARLPSPAEHPSYQNHRRQLWTQILLPLLISLVVILAVIVLITISTFRNNGEVERWAAISTIWIVIPILGAGLMFLVIFSAIVYGMARLLGILPTYTGQAQKFFWRVEGTVKRATDQIVQPVFTLESITASLKHLIGIK